MDELHGKVVASLKKIVADGVDMDRIRLVIKRDKLKVRFVWLFEFNSMD